MREHVVAALVSLGLAPAGTALTDDLQLKDDLGIDSLGMVRLVRALNDGCGVTIRARDLTPENFATVGTLVAFMARLGR